MIARAVARRLSRQEANAELLALPLREYLALTRRERKRGLQRARACAPNPQAVNR